MRILRRRKTQLEALVPDRASGHFPSIMRQLRLH